MFLGSGELINLLSSPLSKINSQWEVKLFGITVDDNLLFNKYINNLHGVKSGHIRSFAGPYFPAFGLNTKSEKTRIRKTPNTDTFHAVLCNIASNRLRELTRIRKCLSTELAKRLWEVQVTSNIKYCPMIRMLYSKRYINALFTLHTKCFRHKVYESLNRFNHIILWNFFERKSIQQHLRRNNLLNLHSIQP